MNRSLRKKGMLSKNILFLLLLFLNKPSFSQGIDNLWLMGYECCSTYFYPMNLDFSSGSLVIDTVQRNMNLESTNGVITDKQGNLLFYTNGVYIANANNDTMLNGSGLNPSQFTTNHTYYGLTIPQLNLIIPFPQDSTKYYLFHETMDDPLNTKSSFFLYYSVVDMNLDNGLGGVVQKNTILLNDTLLVGKMTACKHANGRDWWLIIHEYQTGFVLKFLITPNGINVPQKQNLQAIRYNSNGQVVFSKQGDKYAYYDEKRDLDIFNFDRCNGNFHSRIHVDINDSAAAGGVAFSPSGRFLYVSSTSYVYQFDMNAPNIAASQKTVAIWDTFYSPFPPAATTYYLAQLAPDNKIYINCGNSTLDIHVINYPDSVGAACGFCQHCIHLPALNNFTIPNHPNYFLGPLVGSVCDTLHIGIDDVLHTDNTFNLFPNPANRLVYVTQKANEVIRFIEVFNALGQKMNIKYSTIKNNEYIEVNVQSLLTGVYFMNIVTDKEKVVRKFIRE
jgi:hypothetical protein